MKGISKRANSCYSISDREESHRCISWSYSDYDALTNRVKRGMCKLSDFSYRWHGWFHYMRKEGIKSFTIKPYVRSPRHLIISEGLQNFITLQDRIED